MEIQNTIMYMLKHWHISKKFFTKVLSFKYLYLTWIYNFAQGCYDPENISHKASAFLTFIESKKLL